MVNGHISHFMVAPALIVLAACGAPAQAPTASVSNAIDVAGPGLYVDESGQTIVDRVGSATPGWICIHADREGQPGPVLGCSAVVAGESQAVAVSVDPAQLTPLLHTILYVDGGEVGTLEIPDPDVVALSAGGASISFTEPLLGDFSWITVRDQPLGENNTVVVPRVYTPIAALLVIHNGERGPAIGWTPLHAGENTDVTVTLTFQGELKPLGAMLHWDGGDPGQYVSFNVDPPASVRTGDILVVQYELTKQ